MFSLRLCKSTRVVSNLSISNLPISDFEFTKSNFLATFDLSFDFILCFEMDYRILYI